MCKLMRAYGAVILATVVGVGLHGCGGARSLSNQAVTTALEQIQPGRLRAHMETLAEKSSQDRPKGGHDHGPAAAYVAQSLETLGLSSAGANGAYFQSLPVRKVELIEPQSYLTLIRDGQTVELSTGRDYVLWPDALREQSGVAAAVAFVGFGITAPGLNHDDYAGVNTRGRIIMLLWGAPPSFPSHLQAHYGSLSSKLDNAVAHGAVGVLILQTPKQEERTPWSLVTRHAGEGWMHWLDETGAPNGVWPQLRGLGCLSRAGAEILLAGAPHSPEDIFAAAETDGLEAFELPLGVEFKTASRHVHGEITNVIGVLPGSDPGLRDEYVVFSAHAARAVNRGVQDTATATSVHDGTLDGLSGIAALLETARAFASLPKPPRRSLLFLAAISDEGNLTASDYFANHPTVPVDRIAAGISLDTSASPCPFGWIAASVAEQPTADDQAQSRDAPEPSASARAGQRHPTSRTIAHGRISEAVEAAGTRLDVDIDLFPQPAGTFLYQIGQYPFARYGLPVAEIVGGADGSDFFPYCFGPTRERTGAEPGAVSATSEAQKEQTDRLTADTWTTLARVSFLVGYSLAGE